MPISYLLPDIPRCHFLHLTLTTSPSYIALIPSNKCESPCGKDSICTSRYGQSGCVCSTGYDEHIGGTCTDQDECKDNSHQCSVHAKCFNVPGSYICACKSRYTGDGSVCLAVLNSEQCATSCGMHAECVAANFDTPTCQCNIGYAGDLGHCKDINECLGDHGCGRVQNCINIPGSFQCNRLDENCK
eukprot:Ihof_evm8s283 gene=Ihof_evmTU8s283